MTRSAAGTRAVGASRSLIRLSQLLHAPVVTPSGEAVGRVADIIVRLRGASTYPLVTGIVAEVGGRQVFVGSGSIQRFNLSPIALAYNELDLSGVVTVDDAEPVSVTDDTTSIGKEGDWR